jgi:hypothetical protein
MRHQLQRAHQLAVAAAVAAVVAPAVVAAVAVVVAAVVVLARLCAAHDVQPRDAKDWCDDCSRGCQCGCLRGLTERSVVAAAVAELQEPLQPQWPADPR